MNVHQNPDGTWPELPKDRGPVRFIGGPDPVPLPEHPRDEWLPCRPVAHRTASRWERMRRRIATWLEDHLP